MVIQFVYYKIVRIGNRQTKYWKGEDMCTWAVCWLISREHESIKESWIGWALLADCFIFACIGPGELIHLEFK